MNFQETIELFRQGRLDIDCQSMVLKLRYGPNEVYRGKGYIRQSVEGNLIYKIYVDTHENAEQFRSFGAKGPRPGKLFTDDLLFDLTASAMDGTIWTSERLYPSFHWNMANQSVVVDGKIDTIRADIGTRQNRHFQRLHFFEELEVPLHQMSEAEQNGSKYYIRDLAKFTGLGTEFEVRARKGSGDTVVEMSSNVAFPDAFHLRVQEALQYLTSISINWRARFEGSPENSFIELVTPEAKSHHTLFHLPLQIATSEFMQCGWALFLDYLAYLVASTSGTMWNPVAYHLYNAREVAASTIDAAAVGVSVALEAIASLITPPPEKDDGERLANFQKCMRDFLATLPEFRDLAPRMDGLLRTMGSKRPQDILHALAESGDVERNYIQSWANLRNRHLHPNLTDLKPFDTITAEKLLEDIRRAEVLVHQLVFYLIGYRGPFTDYGIEGFPTRTYPLSSSQECKGK